MRQSGQTIIAELLNYLNIKAPTLAKNIGVKYQRIYDIQKGKVANVSYDLATKICDTYPQINKEWVQGARTPMLQDKGKAKKQLNINIPYINHDELPQFFSRRYAEKPIYSYSLPMFPKADFIIAMMGDAMYPQYKSGDLLVCRILPKEEMFFQWGMVYVLDTPLGITIKKVTKCNDNDYITITPENKSYEPYDLPKSEIRNIALVLGFIRNL